MPASLSRPITVSLDDEERRQLLGFLEPSLRETLVEAHRTESPEFRVFVECKQRALQKLIDKLKEP
jgi:hypothetical protein